MSDKDSSLPEDKPAADPLATEVSDYAPSRRGRYLFRRPLARGGLGVVSICFDTELNREVALKEILDERADDTRARDNFCAEAQVTGSLEHPGIVPIYSLGTGEDGRPYYAMQFITGTELRDRIVQFHQDVAEGTESFKSASFRRLLQRLIDVCNVVHYAHSRGVLHRDLKSINVMLGRYGETFVIDWGLARTTGESEVDVEGAESGEMDSESPVSLSGTGVRHTVEGAVAGTIGYAPPEQLTGKTDQIDARADVFSLGAILYEILTGDPPNHRQSLTEAIRRIESGRIPSPHQVNASVPKPLSAIAMRALSAKREDRYKSAKELRNDIQHWLDDERVSAYSENFFERLYRWKRQHETFVRVATLSLLIISVVAVVAAYRIDLERQRQVEARQQATRLYKIARNATDNFLAKTGDRLEDLPDDFAQVREELLREAADSYRQMQQEAEFANDPELMRESATAAIQLADVLKRFDTVDDRREAIDSLHQARATLQKLDTPQDVVLVARTFTEESRLIADGAETDDDLDQAASVVSEALRISEQWSGGPEVSSEALLARAQAKIQQGNVAALRDDVDRASDSYESAIETLKILLDRKLEQSIDVTTRHELIRAYINDTFVRSPEDPRTGPHYEAALRQAKRLTEIDPNDPTFTKEYGHLLNNYGDYFYFDKNDFVQAETQYRRAAELLRALVDNKPSIPVYKQLLTLSLIGLGNSASDQGRPSDAYTHYEEATAIAAKMTSQSDAYAATAAQAHASLGYAAIKTDPDRAEKMLTKAELLLTNSDEESLKAFVFYSRAVLAVSRAGSVADDASALREQHLQDGLSWMKQAIRIDPSYRDSALEDEDVSAIRAQIEALPSPASE